LCLLRSSTAQEPGRTRQTGGELTALIAHKDPRRHGRAGARWLARWLAENPTATIDEAAFAVACLLALGGSHHGHALTALREMAEGASAAAERTA
jgi:hypothetical protein